MKIERVEIVPAIMLREDPEWRHALSKPGGQTDMKGFILKLISDEGLVGLGYNSSVAHYGSSQGGIGAALEIYKEQLIGEDPFNTERIFGTLNAVLPGNREAVAAVDIALYDLQAKAVGLPVYALLGGLVREEIPVARIVSLKEPAQMAVNALTFVEQGYVHLKIKLNGDPAKDIHRVKEIRKVVGEAVHLTVDANQSYSAKGAIDTLKRMDEYGVELCEQPVRADDWQGLAAVTRSVDCLVEAHESAFHLGDIFRLVKENVADCINITPQRLGGLTVSKIAARICNLGNVSIRVQAIGSRLVTAAAMHLVASTENASSACELGEFCRLLNDPVQGFEVEGGKVKVPKGPGIGVSLLKE
jgi:L-Ala-D/L-Glu epimerase